ncbi:MAG: permease [Rhodospirillales bacterium]|nr:permease [Rhodospirillales bacterium]
MEQVFEAAYTSGGMLWKALWALIFGYLISAGIQVLVTKQQMADLLGSRGIRQASLSGLFGFISSSCSFAALAASRSVYVKGAAAPNALAFLIASTNLVLELGVVLWVLLGWKFTLANFLLGGLMIVYAYALSSVWLPQGLAEQARRNAEHAQRREGMDMQHGMGGDWRKTLASRKGWSRIAEAFFMEWKMVWKEILFGFTIAGFISVFVPQAFWNALFLIDTEGGAADPSLWVVVENALVAPVVAFFTFIGSMGNVPLAAMLWSREASFGGVVAFLGADLVAATVVWVHAKYYGWKFALYASMLLYVCMVVAGVTVHLIFQLFEILPTERPSLREMVRFEIDHTFFLNVGFAIVAALLLWLHLGGSGGGSGGGSAPGRQAEQVRVAGD